MGFGVADGVSIHQFHAKLCDCRMIYATTCIILCAISSANAMSAGAEAVRLFEREGQGSVREVGFSKIGAN